MSMTEPKIVIDPDSLPLAEPPPLPALPAVGPKRTATLRQYAARIVVKLGAPAALLLAAKLDEAVADEAEAEP